VIPRLHVERLLPEDGGMVSFGRFLVDKAEVSIRDYQQVVPTYHLPYGFTEAMPVVNVTWKEAAAYARSQGKRLCALEEWRQAQVLASDMSRAAAGQSLSAGPREANDTQEQHPRGVLNLVGNVSEWLASTNGTAPYIGGHWFADRQALEGLLHVRVLATQHAAQRHIGFRCCVNAQ